MAEFLESVKNKAKESDFLRMAAVGIFLVVFILVIAALVDSCSA